MPIKSCGKVIYDWLKLVKRRDITQHKNSRVILHPVIITLNIYSECVYYKAINVYINICEGQTMYRIQGLPKNVWMQDFEPDSGHVN